MTATSLGNSRHAKVVRGACGRRRPESARSSASRAVNIHPLDAVLGVALILIGDDIDLRVCQRFLDAATEAGNTGLLVKANNQHEISKAFETISRGDERWHRGGALRGRGARGGRKAGGCVQSCSITGLVFNGEGLCSQWRRLVFSMEKARVQLRRLVFNGEGLVFN